MKNCTSCLTKSERKNEKSFRQTVKWNGINLNNDTNKKTWNYDVKKRFVPLSFEFGLSSLQWEVGDLSINLVTLKKEEFC